jgi:hypothetical protein
MSLAAGIATADPSRPDTEDDGLSQNESTTLWSHDTDQYLTQAAHQQTYDSDRTAVQQVAVGTDTAVYPPHANLTSSTYIEDTHATIFALWSIRQRVGISHLQTTQCILAPNGTVRGFIDYRVWVPGDRSTGAR